MIGMLTGLVIMVIGMGPVGYNLWGAAVAGFGLGVVVVCALQELFR